MGNKEFGVLTELRNIILRYRFIILSILLVVVGGMLLLAGEYFSGVKVISSLSEEVGMALLVSGTMGIGVEYYTRKQFNSLLNETMVSVLSGPLMTDRLDSLKDAIGLGNDIKELGLKQVYIDRTMLDLKKHLLEAKPGSDINLLAICMTDFTNAPMQIAIEGKLKEGCKVRLLMMWPESEFIKKRAMEENRSEEDLRADIIASAQLHANFLRRLPVELRDKIDLGYYDAMPNYFIFSTNNVVVVGFYLRGNRGMFFPHLELEVKEDGLGTPFNSHFYSLWENRIVKE